MLVEYLYIYTENDPQFRPVMRVRRFSVACCVFAIVFQSIIWDVRGKGATPRVSTSSSSSSRFNCTVDYTPPPFPTNDDVTKLHPAHVDVVMAMGDSITAGFAARGTLYEARDISWSVGKGKPEQLTLPWLLSQYRGDPSTRSPIQGASVKAVLPKDIAHLPHDDYHPDTDFLNVAESQGAAHRGSMDEQWAFLHTAASTKIDGFDDKWKVLTIWMTANDVCGKCDGPLVDSAYLNAWIGKHDEVLRNVTSTMRKVYVNLVSTLDLSNVHRIQRSKIGCTIEHKYILQECGCIDRGNETELAQLDANVHAMNDALHDLAAKWYNRIAASNRTDVAVVVQTFQEEIGSTLDASFLNPLDCFHPSTEGHELLAVGLWNSMLCTGDRYNRCGEHFDKSLAPVCPNRTSVFYTGPDVKPGPPPLL